MRLPTFTLLILGTALSGCASIKISPAEFEKSPNGDGTIKYRRPSIAVEPFGENNGRLHLKLNRNSREVTLEYRLKF